MMWHAAPRREDWLGCLFNMQCDHFLCEKSLIYFRRYTNVFANYTKTADLEFSVEKMGVRKWKWDSSRVCETFCRGCRRPSKPITLRILKSVNINSESSESTVCRIGLSQAHPAINWNPLIAEIYQCCLCWLVKIVFYEFFRYIW